MRWPASKSISFTSTSQRSRCRLLHKLCALMSRWATRSRCRWVAARRLKTERLPSAGGTNGRSARRIAGSLAHPLCSEVHGHLMKRNPHPQRNKALSTVNPNLLEVEVGRRDLGVTYLSNVFFFCGWTK